MNATAGRLLRQAGIADIERNNFDCTDKCRKRIIKRREGVHAEKDSGL